MELEQFDVHMQKPKWSTKLGFIFTPYLKELKVDIGLNVKSKNGYIGFY